MAQQLSELAHCQWNSFHLVLNPYFIFKGLQGSTLFQFRERSNPVAGILFWCFFTSKVLSFFIRFNTRIWHAEHFSENGYYFKLFYSWRFSRYSASIYWLVQSHMTSNNEMSGQHCENYDVKRETVHCYLRNVDCCCTWSEVAWCCRWNLSAFFKICFCFVLLYNKSLNNWSLGKQCILFLSNLNVSLDFDSGNIVIRGKQSSLFYPRPVPCEQSPDWSRKIEETLLAG